SVWSSRATLTIVCLWWSPEVVPFLFSLDETAPSPSFPHSLHDALPISLPSRYWLNSTVLKECPQSAVTLSRMPLTALCHGTGSRSEEHTSALQSRENLVCRLLLEKKNLYLPSNRFVAVMPALRLDAYPP